MTAVIVESVEGMRRPVSGLIAADASMGRRFRQDPDPGVPIRHRFFGPLIYLNDIANHTVPLALRAFIDSTGQSAWGQLSAMSVLALLPIFLFFLAFQRLIIYGVAMPGLKR
jgi:hypothetical protein